MNPTDEKNPTQGLRLYNPNPIRMGELHVSCIELTETETRIDFIYFAPKKYTNRTTPEYLAIAFRII